MYEAPGRADRGAPKTAVIPRLPIGANTPHSNPWIRRHCYTDKRSGVLRYKNQRLGCGMRECRQIRNDAARVRFGQKLSLVTSGTGG